MKTLMFAVCVAAAVLIPWSAAAAQNPAHGDSPKVSISVAQPTSIGNAILKPGDYRFQCKHIDGKTFLVVSQVDTGKELVRVPCTEESLPQKAEYSELRSIIAADGTRVLQSVRIKGETIGHRVAE
jgi:hypothetical protein